MKVSGMPDKHDSVAVHVVREYHGKQTGLLLLWYGGQEGIFHYQTFSWDNIEVCLNAAGRVKRSLQIIVCQIRSLWG